MTNADVSITMPHRYCVRYERPGLIVEFETELAAKSLIFYPRDPKVIEGSLTDEAVVVAEVAQWLRQKFDHVEIDRTPKPTFQ